MKLNTLSDNKLIFDLKNLVSREREILSQVLWHLKEIDQRKLYARESCGSLFEYCVKALKYSEGQAGRRVSACRLLREMPEITSKIENGTLNLTQLNQAKQFFHEENIIDRSLKKEIIKKLEGHSTRESEKILWSLKSEDTPRKVSITIKDDTYQKLKKLQALKAHACPDLDSFFDKVFDELNIIWNPELKRTRASARVSLGHTRYVSQKDKAFIWKRDNGKCKNCGSKYALEIDHIKAYALGGKTIPENLQLLCRNCNQRKGMELFGNHGRPIPNKPDHTYVSE